MDFQIQRFPTTRRHFNPPAPCSYMPATASSTISKIIHFGLYSSMRCALALLMYHGVRTIGIRAVTALRPSFAAR